jgi:hypothetical protein
MLGYNDIKQRDANSFVAAGIDWLDKARAAGCWVAFGMAVSVAFAQVLPWMF